MMESNASKKRKFFRKLYVIDYNTEAKVNKTLIELAIFICFLTVTTIVALSAHHKYLYFYNNAIERLFVSRSTRTRHGSVSYNNLVTTAEWIDFLERNVFVQLLEGNEDDDDDKDSNKDKQEEGTIEAEKKWSQATGGRNRKPGAPLLPVQRLFLGENLLIGPARLRQIRVKEHSCYVHEVFNRYFNNCYDRYRASIESVEPEFKGTKFYTLEELNAIPVWGKAARYIGAGYIKNLVYDKEGAQAILNELKEKNWFDRGTRLLIMEFVLYNGNTNLFNNVKFLAEHLPTGGIVPTWRAQVVMLHGIWTVHRGTLLIAVIIFYVLVIFYTAVEIFELTTMNLKEYFKSFWNYVDWSILMSAYTAFVLSIVHPFLMEDFLNAIKNSPDVYQSLDIISFCYMFYLRSMALCTFLVWIKIFRYLSFNKTMAQFSLTLRRCSIDLLGFGLMFFIIFVAFALLGLLLFGGLNSDFKDFKSSILTIMRMILGDFRYQRIERNSPIMGPIFFLSYIALVFLILLNMFLAIINETYTTVRNEMTEERSVLKPVLSKFMSKIISFLKKCCRRKKSRKKDDENIKNGEENDNDDRGDVNDAPLYSEEPTTSRDSKAKPPSDDEVLHLFTGEQAQAPAYASIEAVEQLKERVELLEDILEQLIDHMDRILSAVKSKNKTE